jgi:hypothetical protein
MGDMPGPTALVPDCRDNQTLLIAAALCVLYSGAPPTQACKVVCGKSGNDTDLIVTAISRQDAQHMLI